jgi:hypothetical protein
MPVRPPGKARLPDVPVVDDRVMSPTQRRFVMETRREEQKPVERPTGAKQKRFRIVKLEERIAPSKGGNGTRNTCANTYCGTWCDFTHNPCP